MKTSTLSVIRMALAALILAIVLAPLSAAAGAARDERATWRAEWVRPQVEMSSRSIGVLKLRDGKLSFAEQNGQLDWELDLGIVKRVATANGGRSLIVSAVTGEEFIVSIMQPDMTQGSPKKALSIIERAVHAQAASSR
jgi:hypothetical protein